jgi:hypothetical protein
LISYFIVRLIVFCICNLEKKSDIIIEDKNLKIKFQFYFQVPQTEMEWKEVARCFLLKWNFNDANGAIDGKHIAVQKPRLSGVLYCNYKGCYSVVLMAAVNAHYEFLIVDAEVNGCISDGGVLNHTEFWRLCESPTGDSRTFTFIWYRINVSICICEG